MASGNAKKNNIAIFAVTARGADLGRRLKIMLPGSRLFMAEKRAAGGPDEQAFSTSLKDSVHKAFNEYGALVLIMAAGIAVRLLAPVLTDKHKDPGVVVVDDAGTFVLSLLSGHIGGANDLARKVASCIGAAPVITTASDTIGTIKADILGREYRWEIEANSNLTKVSADLVEGRLVGIWQETGEKGWRPGGEPLHANVRLFRSIKALSISKPAAALLITDRVLIEKEKTQLPKHTVTYRPKSLVIGIGCNRGVASAVVEEAVSAILSKQGLSIKSVRNIATIDKKMDETGLQEFAGKQRLQIDYFSSDRLSRTAFPSPASKAALEHVGTPAVCESAAIFSSGGGPIIVPKTSYKRAVTVAIARINFDKHPATAKGKVYVIGIGPGDPCHMTLRAREALDRCEIVLGYKTYIKLIETLLQGKKIISSGMGAEVDRAKQAVELAGKGKEVSLVSSGDSGIYGMAGLVAEIIAERPESAVDMEVIPGVPAFVAASALLGAPLMNDFVSISLSDHLVPWKEIQGRLKIAARGDFIIVLYNPRSRQRPLHLTGAREIIMRYRSASTPVGVVTDANRPGQEVVITDLGRLPEFEVGMNTVVIIGNSRTFVAGGRLITRRGYHTKYDLKEIGCSRRTHK